MSTIFYAPKDLEGQNIKEIEFNGTYELNRELFNLSFPIKLDTVYLIAVLNEIIVTDDILEYTENDGFIVKLFNSCSLDCLFVQEYSSFEEAYKVALEMREGQKLCYKK